MSSRPVREAIEEVDDDSWIIGDKMLLSRASVSECTSAICTWADGKGGGYALFEAPVPLPKTRPLSATSEIKKIFDVAERYVTFEIGEVHLKVTGLYSVASKDTREHVTLAWLHERNLERPWSFAFPTVKHHAEYEYRYYIFLTKVPGVLLDTLWPSLDQDTKRACAKKIADICAHELAIPSEGDTISGIDGNYLAEYYLQCGTTAIATPDDCDPENLRKSCLDFGMDCSTLVFYHCNLCPSTVLLDQATGSIGITYWSGAGFVPTGWIRTKFEVSAGMVLENYPEEPREWSMMVTDELARMGLPEHKKAFLEWSKVKLDGLNAVRVGNGDEPIHTLLDMSSIAKC